jgi:nicotinamide-nucleotide amidase
MNAEIIAVGSELLTPQRIDTNSLYLTQKLGERGIEVVRKSVIGDDHDRLTAEIKRSRDAAEVVILSGGLGPTLDDLTRDAAAAAVRRKLEFHEAIVQQIAERFRRFNRDMAEVNKRQAYILEGAEILHNPNGTAPGQWFEDENGILILLPGPPRELEPLFEASCLPRFDRRESPHRYFTHSMRVAGIGESDVDQRIGPIYSIEERVATTILSAPGDIQIHLRARAQTEVEARGIAEGLGTKIQRELGDAVYTLLNESLEVVVAGLMRTKGLKLAAAESCTGGLLAGKITDVPGSSEFFAGSFVSYANNAKINWLGVDAAIIEVHGAVSELTAAAMATAARDHAAKVLGGPAIGISTTGIAGPDGGTDENPVGTVYFGIADADGVVVKRRQLGGGRDRIRTLAVQTALELLRRRLLGLLES